MVIYDAKIFLKQEATQEKCIDLFLKWIKNSPQYKEKSKGLIQNACDLRMMNINIIKIPFNY